MLRGSSAFALLRHTRLKGYYYRQMIICLQPQYTVYLRLYIHINFIGLHPKYWELPSTSGISLLPVAALFLHGQPLSPEVDGTPGIAFSALRVSSGTENQIIIASSLPLANC